MLPRLRLQVIFRYTLALFKYKEDDLLKIHDSVEIYQYLRFFTKTVTDSRYAFCVCGNAVSLWEPSGSSRQSAYFSESLLVLLNEMSNFLIYRFCSRNWIIKFSVWCFDLN